MPQQHGRMTQAEFDTLMANNGVSPVDSILESINTTTININLTIMTKAQKARMEANAYKLAINVSIAKQQTIDSLSPGIELPPLKNRKWYPCGICGDPLCPLGIFGD